MKNLLQLLSISNFYGESENIDIAKGINEIPKSTNEALKQAIRKIKAFNPDAKFNALSSSLSGVASGFAAYQGALGLAGVESKDLEEQLLKVQSAMAVAQGLQGLGEARDSFKQLKAVAIDAFKGIKTAIGSTGIGLLVVALGALYTYWDDIKELVGGVSEEQKKLNAQVDQQVALENEKLDELNNQDNILKSQGKTEKEILQYKVAQIEAAQLVGEIQLKNDYITKENQIAAAKRNHDYLKTFLDFVTFPQKKLTEFFFTFVNQAISVLNKIPGVDIAVFNVDKILKNFDGINTKIANLIFDPKETTSKADAVIKEHKKGLNKLENDKQGLLLQIKNIDNEEIKSNKAKNDKIAEDKKAADEKEKTEAEKRRQELIDNANELNEALAESDKARQKQKEDQAAADEKMRAEGLEKLKEDARKQLEINKQLQEQKFNAVKDGLSTISNLAELFAGKSRKQQQTAFNIQKGVNIASAVIDTYKAANLALASSPPPFSFIAAGAAITAGLLNVKKIASTKFDSGGTPSAEKPANPASPGSVITPNFNIVGNNGTNQLKQLQQAPVQAYVVSGEMSTQQSLDRNRLRNATL